MLTGDITLYTLSHGIDIFLKDLDDIPESNVLPAFPVEKRQLGPAGVGDQRRQIHQFPLNRRSKSPTELMISSNAGGSVKNMPSRMAS